MWSSNPTLGHIYRENHNQKTYMHPSVIEALFTIAKTQKQPKCPSTEEWIKKIRYISIYRLEYYLAIKKNKIMPFAATWMNLEIIILSEVRQRQISYDITHMWNQFFKSDTNELIYKVETDLQILKISVTQLPKRKCGGEG